MFREIRTSEKIYNDPKTMMHNDREYRYWLRVLIDTRIGSKESDRALEELKRIRKKYGVEL